MQMNKKICKHWGKYQEECEGCDDFISSCYPESDN